MKHIASRLVRYANENKVIHSDHVTDVALKKLATDRTINHKIRSALYEIDPQLELVIPRQVDEREKQFKRFLQYHHGLIINLSDLKNNHSSTYRKLQVFGSPAPTIEKWGLDYTYDRNLVKKDFKRLLGAYAVNRTIRRLYSSDQKLYMAIAHQAKKENRTVKTYIEKLGFNYVQGEEPTI